MRTLDQRSHSPSPTRSLNTARYHLAVPPRKNADELLRDPRRRRIHERLKLIGAGPAAFYRDACRILDAEAGLSPQVVREPSERAGDMQDPPLRLVAAAHLVGHLFRDIENAIRQVLVPAGVQIDPCHKHKTRFRSTRF